MDVKTIREAAAQELRDESFKRAVAEEKIRMKTRKPWWHYLMPFTITITKR